MRSPLAALVLALAARAQVPVPPLVWLLVRHDSVTVTASPVEPGLERRNEEVLRRTLFSRDDQIFHLIAAGIDAGQHEGGGKSIEVRRYGFNLDHGGVNGGLKILVDGIQQNQTTQGHGQGYLGSLKTVSPELIREIQVLNGPFSAEYGDFSGLGVVHIRLRDSLPDRWTLRLNGGSFGARRAFLAFSPEAGETYVAYEGSFTDGPFENPLRYRRDNLTAHLGRGRAGLRLNAGRNRFSSSGQVPLDAVRPFAAVDPTGGGAAQAGTLAAYYDAGSTRADAFVSRSLVDLYSNFTFFLDDPENGDAFEQHDSRLQQGANVQHVHSHEFGLFTAGANFHANQVRVGLYPRAGRTRTGVTTLAHAHVTNAAGYAQQMFSLFSGRLQAGGGVRYDLFRTSIRDLVGGPSAAEFAGRIQPKLHLAWIPSVRWPATLYVNYGRGISSSDARSLVTAPGERWIATTDFTQLGLSHQFRRVSLVTDFFWIDRSNELVYVADDGSLDFQGPTRAYGYEAKVSVEIARRLSLDGGVTKVLNAFYRGTAPREYVDRAPHFVGGGGLTLSSYRGWSGSLRVRAINHYRLEAGAPPASGHTVFDLAVSRAVRRGVDLSVAVDNLTDRAYYETQNWFVSRLRGQPPVARIHGTPGNPLTVTAGLGFRFGAK